MKRNLGYSCFFFPLFHKHLFSPGLPRATRLLETSCLEKITVCVIETMLVTLPLVQMNKARRAVNRTNQDKHRKSSSSFCYTLNPWEPMPLNIKWNEIFFKKYLLVETFSDNCNNFSNSFSQKLHILLYFFITYFTNFIYSSPNLWS